MELGIPFSQSGTVRLLDLSPAFGRQIILQHMANKEQELVQLMIAAKRELSPASEIGHPASEASPS